MHYIIITLHMMSEVLPSSVYPCTGKIPHQDNSPLCVYWSCFNWLAVVLVGSNPSWGVVLGIVVLMGNNWAEVLSGGEMS